MDQLVFGRYSREECGLPPVGEMRRPTRRSLALKTVLLLAALVAAGWMAGVFAARWREAWVNSLPALVSRAGPEETAELLSRGRIYATALADNQRVRSDFALALQVAAERSVRRMGYYGNLANIYTRHVTDEGRPEREFATEFAASGVYAELKDYTRAFACLAKADQALSRYQDEKAKHAHRLLLVNAQAYYLAVAPIRSGGNAEKALHLAQLLISSRDELADGSYASDQAAFLDTLASAWFATGDAEKAVETQSLALGLADSGRLDVYIENFDKFKRAAKAKARGK